MLRMWLESNHSTRKAWDAVGAEEFRNTHGAGRKVLYEKNSAKIVQVRCAQARKVSGLGISALPTWPSFLTGRVGCQCVGQL